MPRAVSRSKRLVGAVVVGASPSRWIRRRTARLPYRCWRAMTLDGLAASGLSIAAEKLAMSTPGAATWRAGGWRPLRRFSSDEWSACLRGVLAMVMLPPAGLLVAGL